MGREADSCHKGHKLRKPVVFRYLDVDNLQNTGVQGEAETGKHL